MKTPMQIADEEITSRFGIRPALMDPTVAITTSTLREMIESAVISDRAERPDVLVVIRNGEVLNEDVDIYDLTFIDGSAFYEYDQGDIDTMVPKLRAAGWDSAADDLEEWWAGR